MNNFWLHLWNPQSDTECFSNRLIVKDILKTWNVTHQDYLQSIGHSPENHSDIYLSQTPKDFYETLDIVTNEKLGVGYKTLQELIESYRKNQIDIYRLNNRLWPGFRGMLEIGYCLKDIAE